MIKNHSIQIKAAFLLVVFATNTIVGFACSMGLDMGFNTKHHLDENSPEVFIHVHANGKKHVHQKKTNTNSHDRSHQHNKLFTESFVHEHSNYKRYIHKEKTNNNQPDKFVPEDEAGNNNKVKDENENCCNDKVVKFEQLAKSVVYTFHIENPVFFTAFVSVFYNYDVSFRSQGSPNIKYFVRSHHPPISDIRIAIQSFQV